MQRIERYGVVALVFLLVTVAAVSFWGEDRETKPEETARVEPEPRTPATAPQRPRQGRAENPRDARPTVPLAEQRGAARAGGTVPIEPRPTPAAPVSEQPLAGEPAAADAPLQLDWPEVEPLPGRHVEERAPERSPLAQRAELDPRIPPADPEPSGGGARADFVWYEVQPAETLSEIALRALGSSQRWREIQDLNGGLAPEALRAGAKIKLPKGAVVAATPPPAGPAGPAVPAARPGAAGTWSYTVQRGDTLSRIAARELGGSRRLADIVALNPGLDPDHILVGARLSMPARGGQAPAPGPGALAAAEREQAARPARRSGSRVR